MSHFLAIDLLHVQLFLKAGMVNPTLYNITVPF